MLADVSDDEHTKFMKEISNLNNKLNDITQRRDQLATENAELKNGLREVEENTKENVKQDYEVIIRRTKEESTHQLTV